MAWTSVCCSSNLLFNIDIFVPSSTAAVFHFENAGPTKHDHVFSKKETALQGTQVEMKQGNTIRAAMDKLGADFDMGWFQRNVCA